MRKPLLSLLLILTSGVVTAQTFNGLGGLPIPPGAPAQTIGITQSPCAVGGIGILGGCSSIDNVQINLQHTFVGDIGILLIGPGGQVLELSTSNGGGGDDYANTVFTDNTSNFITSGAPPYAGTFRPEGRVTNLSNPYSNAPPLGTHTFANTYDGTNADGIWTLYINDYVAIDVGVVLNWSITFNTGGVPPIADAGPDITVCTGAGTSLTAAGGNTYAWNTGATTAMITVTPAITSTYTVTVTNPGCGSDTDEVIVTVQPSQVTVSADPVFICPGQTSTLTAVTNLTDFAWSNGAGNSSSITVGTGGNYTVTATNSLGCTATATLNVMARNNPAVTMHLTNTNVCPGDCPNIGMTFTGSPPFNLSGELIVGGTSVVTFNQFFPGFNGNVNVCVPPDTPPGQVMIKATSLIDAFCTCE